MAKQEQIVARVDAELAQRVRQRAKDEDRSVGDIVRRALNGYLGTVITNPGEPVLAPESPPDRLASEGQAKAAATAQAPKVAHGGRIVGQRGSK